jgi:hypothetical protein
MVGAGRCRRILRLRNAGHRVRLDEGDERVGDLLVVVAQCDQLVDQAGVQMPAAGKLGSQVLSGQCRRPAATPRRMPRTPARHAVLLRTARASLSLPFLRRPLSPLAVELVAPAPLVVGERFRGPHAVRPVRLPERGGVGARAARHGSVRTCRAPRVVSGPRGRRMEEIPGRRARAPPGTRRSRGGNRGLGEGPLRDGRGQDGRPPPTSVRPRQVASATLRRRSRACREAAPPTLAGCPARAQSPPGRPGPR